MSLQYSEPALTDLLQEFDKFVTQTTQTQLSASTALTSSTSRRETEVLTPFQARLTLTRLIERGKSVGERKNWKVQETSYLLFLVEEYCLANRVKCEQLGPLDWQRISRLFPYRNASACQFRYLSLNPASISNIPWSSNERQLLHRIIQNQKTEVLNWRKISEQLYELSQERHFRTGKQCREHYCCFLKPNLKKGAWTNEEDYSLVTLFLRMGRKWSKMAKLIEGRNENAIKNRFFLMFENRKDMKLSNPDLIKMVRRRKEKIQRTLILPNEQRVIEDEHIIMTATGSQSSNFEFSAEREEPGQPTISTESEIFLSQQRQTAIKIEEEQFSSREEFEKYIDL